jgi:thioredoxin-like negative regulator of GroEL
MRMNRVFRILARLSALVAAAALPCLASIPWIKDDADAAFVEAKQKNRPVLLYFHTTWCSWCTEFERKVFSQDEVSSEANAFVPLMVNGDRRGGQALLRRFNVTTFPTILAVTPKSEVVGRLAMYVGPADFIRFMRESLQPGESLAAVDRRIDAGERAPDLLIRSAGRHYEAGDFDEAQKRYQEAIAAAPSPSPLGADARLGAARILAMKGDAAGALQQYREVLRSYPDSNRRGEGFVCALFLLREDKKTGEIDALYKEFGGRFPDDPAVLNDYARHLLETGGDPALALEKAARAVGLDPQSPDYEATRARALLAVKRPGEAMDAAMKALSMRPTDKDLWLLRMAVQDAQRAAASARPASAPTPSPDAPAPGAPGASSTSTQTPPSRP